MNKRGIILAASVLLLLLFLPMAGSGAIYKYVDDQGVTNFTDNINKVPKKYQGRVEAVKTQIQVQGKQAAPENKVVQLLGKSELTWQDFIIKNPGGDQAGVNLRKLFVQSLFESRLIFWLAGELALSIIMLILLAMFISWPTARGRLIGLASVLAGWVACSAVFFFVFTMPSAREFFAISRGYLSEVAKEAPLDEQGKKTVEDLNRKLGDLQGKLL